MNWKSRDALWIYGLGACLFVVTAFVYEDYFRPEWRDYQAGFRELVTKRFGAARAEQVPGGLQQVWARDVGRVDRCTTCHQGVEWSGLENAPEPYRSHPKEILAKHPISKYGCTPCHGGQGFAVDLSGAHATAIDHWEEPLLATELGKTYLVSDRTAMIQSNCNTCHRYDRSTSGADYINDAKKIVQQKGCRACHKINGRGGVIGPDLTYIGDQSAEQYDYTRMSGVKTVFGWHLAHFKDPKSMVSTTVMPNFGLNTHDAQSLALLVMSWKRAHMPIEYIPGAKVADLPTPEEQAKEQQMLTGEGAFFVKNTCFICHDVSTLGIESAAKIGPDLANAEADVQNRFGRQLDDFLMNPSGTMSMVLGTQIHLTDEEKREAIAKLKIAYEKKVEQDAKAAKGKKT